MSADLSSTRPPEPTPRGLRIAEAAAAGVMALLGSSRWPTWWCAISPTTPSPSRHSTVGNEPVCGDVRWSMPSIPREFWSPFGAFSMAVIQGDGQVVHLKGQVSLDQAGQIVGKNDMRVQVRRTLENVRTVLASMGGRMADVVSLVHYTTEIDKFMGTGDIRKEFFSAPFPVTTTVQIDRLYHPDLMIEITAVAEIPRERFRRPPS